MVLAEASLSHDQPRQSVALLADRDDDTRMMYATYLGFAGWKTVETPDGRDALAVALTEPPAVCVTDSRLFGLDGYELCQLLRHDPATHAVAIVMVTADVQPADMARGRAAGADAVLTKPCLPDALLQEITRIRSQSAALRDRSARLHEQIQDQLVRAQATMAKAGRMSKTFPRYETTTPPDAVPVVICPTCDRPLLYEHSYIGGVSPRHPEQWDRFTCQTRCGRFEYRHRTRQVRRVA
jgi:two-component system, cell cycle response regulator DivK